MTWTGRVCLYPPVLARRLTRLYRQEADPAAVVRRLASRIVTLCWVELRKIRHDRTELCTRAIQPALWLIIFGETFSRIHAIPTPGGIPYLAYLAPGILAQSALFIAIFYGIQIIWERDAGVLTKLMVTPTPRAALITGKAFAAGVRARRGHGTRRHGGGDAGQVGRHAGERPRPPPMTAGAEGRGRPPAGHDMYRCRAALPTGQPPAGPRQVAVSHRRQIQRVAPGPRMSPVSTFPAS